MPDPEPARYPVKIGFGALRNPPDVSALTAVNADLEFYLTGEFTEAEFAAISDRDLRHYLSLATDGPGSWTVRVGPEDALAGENNRSPQERCIAAWLKANRPDHDYIANPPATLALGWERITLPALYFLMDLFQYFYAPGEYPDDDTPWEKPNDRFLLERMEQAGIAYTDLADWPESG